MKSGHSEIASDGQPRTHCCPWVFTKGFNQRHDHYRSEKSRYVFEGKVGNHP